MLASIFLLTFFIIAFVISGEEVWVTRCDLIFLDSNKISTGLMNLVFLLSLALITTYVRWFGETYISTDKQKPEF